MHTSLLFKYKDFTESDFITDTGFQDWCINPTSTQNTFWGYFTEQFPEKKQEILNASNFIKTLQFKQDFPEEAYVHEKYLTHLQSLEYNLPAKLFKINPSRSKKFLSIAAAAISGIIVIGILAFYFNAKSNSTQVVTSQYGESKTILLADSSLVVLNANSSVTFSKFLHEDQPREIWLKGEAYFNIKHINKNPKAILPNDRMLVHGDNFILEVLGTSFNIRQRRNMTEIVLQSGKIELTFLDNLKTKFILHPNDIVSYNSTNHQINRSSVVADQYVKWKNKDLVLQNPTLEEIIRYLEDNYGKKIILANPQLNLRKIEGPIKLDNLNDALFIISTTLNIEIEDKGSFILFSSR